MAFPGLLLAILAVAVLGPGRATVVVAVGLVSVPLLARVYPNGLADVNVKHSAPLADRPLGEEVAELLDRGGADALVVTGSATGEAVNLNELRCVKELAQHVPVLLGSGVTPENVRTFLPYADGFIVGTGVKHDAVVHHRVDAARVARLVAAVQQHQQSRRPAS